jgi:hypothetical protein
MDSFCTMLADLIGQAREEVAGSVRRAVGLEGRLAQLEGQPDVGPGEVERVRNDLAEANRQLADAQERLMGLEHEYDFARNPVLG